MLIVQLKRFSFRSFIWRDKINDLVEFPVRCVRLGCRWGRHCGRPPGPPLTVLPVWLGCRNLDLSKFCIGQKEEQLPSYDLYAVINHYGGMIGGHYTACARLPSERSSQRSDVGEARAASGTGGQGGGAASHTLPTSWQAGAYLMTAQ